MRAVALAEAGQPLAVVEQPDPVPAPGELLLRVDACGICGSDLHLSDAVSLPGLVMGHEYCGTVVEVWLDVDGWAEGDRVAGLPLATCGRCAACLGGRPRKCLAAAMIGIERPGAYAEYVAQPAAGAYRLPPSIDATLGALVEPLAVGLHTVVRAGLRPGDDALVIGGGPVGLAVALWLRALGAREVVVSDPVASRRALAERIGATATVDPTTDDVAAAFAAQAGGGPSVVVECVGVPGLIQHAVDVAAVDATVVIAGVCFQPDAVQPLAAMQKELDVRFAFYYTAADWHTTIALLDQERVDARPLVTDEVTLDEAPDRFAALKHPTDECKVLIRPSS
jgi:2-desacetyl-2-hydroxyethyl bacteriochlorophyllide A dehydrogenase